MPGPMPVKATLDLMIRPTGVEPFSRFDALGTQLHRPDGFPTDCAIRTVSPSDIPSKALIRAHLHLFGDLTLKALVIAPTGLRLVLLAEGVWSFWGRRRSARAIRSAVTARWCAPPARRAGPLHA